MKLILRAFLFVVALTPLHFATAAEQLKQPNVVFILADDLGWSDTTLFGTTELYETPHIQRLAARGMTFTRVYSASPLCSPTRASILTGLSPARIGLTAPNCHLPVVTLTAEESLRGAVNSKATVPGSVTRLNTNYYTLSEMFQDNGYATAHFGKWHLGPEPYSPLEHGFDVDIPHWPGPGPAGSFVAPWKFPDFDPQTPQEHIEDRMADEAVAFMESHTDKPFFLNYWMFSVHAPFDAKQELIDAYRGKINPKDPQRSPTYAAMIESMDEAVGTLLDALDRLKLSHTTIIVFASDNGGNMYNEVDGTTPTSNAPLRGGKATMFEGGVRGPGIVVVPKLTKAGSTSDAVIQSTDFYPTFLELLNIKPQPNQQFDGISIVPALAGKSLDRESIFTYFPHDPRVPDWLPPAVSVHHGDWKLIRLFHNGEHGEHRWKLFNLKDDIGEQYDLAALQPDKVKELDTLIESFLVSTKAVRPLANPNFDPTQYRIEDEGVSRMNEPKAKAPQKELPPVAGWTPGRHATLKVKGSELIINSSGQDPYLSRRLPKPLPPGKYSVEFELRGGVPGLGEFFWQEQGVFPKFHHERSQAFDVFVDHQTHTYRLDFEASHPIVAIRLDPARAAGEIRLHGIKILKDESKMVYRWSPTKK